MVCLLVFFQRFWANTKTSMCNCIFEVFNQNKILDWLNKTLIYLIPKGNINETINGYRPISLCNTVLKIISKVLTARLRPFLEKIISPFKSAFVPNRKTSDNIIILREIIHTIDRSKAKNGFMIIKLDLEKAYDSIEWSFIRDVLKFFEFPSQWIQLVMSLISIVSYQILFNGGKLDPIIPSRGLRQGDPLSPYLFILCMEYLHFLIHDKCQRKLWDPIKSRKYGLAFSHLFYADDIILFAKANSKNCRTILQTLQDFAEVSDLKINFQKSKVYFSKNVDNRTRDLLSSELQISHRRDLDKYLGMQIKSKYKASDFQFLVDRIRERV